jgi:hypothetical protein
MVNKVTSVGREEVPGGGHGVRLADDVGQFVVHERVMGGDDQLAARWTG